MADPVVVVEGRGAGEPAHLPPSGRRRRLLRPAGAAVVVVVVVVVLCGVLVASRHGGRPRPAALPTLGPAHDVYDGDLGDPFVLPVKLGGKLDRFVAFGTGDWPARVPTASSADLTGWKEGGDALPQLPPWAAPDPRNSLSWAPAALQLDDRYLLYVTLPEAVSGQQCIGAATATVAEGPYVGVGDGPLLCQHELGGSIDPAVARDRGGRALPGHRGAAAGAAVRARWPRDPPRRPGRHLGRVRHLEPPDPQRALLLLPLAAAGPGALGIGRQAGSVTQPSARRAPPWPGPRLRRRRA